MKTFIGENPQIDQGVIIGYRPSRKIVIKNTVIGDNARIRSNTVIYTNVVLGNNCEIGHNVIIREECNIGKNISIWSNSTIDYGCNVGNNVKIDSNVYIAQYTTIEDDVFLAPGVVTANDLHPICTKCMKGPTIKKGARIGVNATILPHIVIGEYALVGAGSVVTHDVPSRYCVFGNTARLIKITDDLKCRFNIVDKPYLHGKDVKSREMKFLPEDDTQS